MKPNRLWLVPPLTACKTEGQSSYLEIRVTLPDFSEKF